jgi:hypothetical protein
MTLFAIDVPRMFATRDDGKYVERQVLRPLARVPPVIWLDQFITILSGR